jgi:hypothetical protein
MLSTRVVLILLLGQTSLAAPIYRRQLAGEGSACNSIFTSTDNGVGYGIEYAEENAAKMLSSNIKQRQLHGEGEACDSILTQTDNGVGYGIENAENNVAANIAGLTGHKVTGGGTSTGSAAPAPPAPGPAKPNPKPHKRQLDKIANGFGEIGQAAGLDSSIDPLVTQLDSLDGTLTDGAANLGSDLGTTEVNSLEALGSAVPTKQKRQADKIAYGAAALGQAGGLSKFTGPITNSIASLDGTLTDGVANLGSGVADSEESMLEGTGSAVPVVF